MSDIRQRAKQAAAKRQTEQVKKVEPKTAPVVEVKPPSAPVKRRISKFWYVFLALLLIATAAGVINMVQRVQQVNADVEADTAWIGLGAYCGRVLARETNISDCDAWREWIRQDYSQVVIDCNNASPWLYDDETFYECLEDGLPDTTGGSS